MRPPWGEYPMVRMGYPATLLETIVATNFLFMNTTNAFSEAKLTEPLVTPEHLSRSFLDACDCSINAEPLNQELEYLWDDEGSSGKPTRYIWGKSAEIPSLRARVLENISCFPGR